MTGFLLRRVLLAVCVLVAVSAIAFGLLRLSGDLATGLAGDQGGEAYAAFLRREYGLDRPLHEQYLS